MNYNINKGIVNKLSALGLCGMMVFAASCKKYTELNPLASLSEKVTFESPAEIELAMNGVYRQAAVGTYNGGAGRGYPFGAAAIEQAEMRGEDMVNTATFFQITYESTITTNSPNNENHWNNLYNLVNQGNVLIAGVQKAGENGVLTKEAASSYEAEARFLRALSHHELLLHFSKPYADANGGKPGVPYRMTAINTPGAVNEAILLKRGTVAEDYAKVLEDLDYAEANLPVSQSLGFSRATKGAAIALKTRIKLHMGDWAGVLAEGAKLGVTGSGPYTSTVGGYALTASPETPFVSFNSNTESIFSIANSPTSNPSVNGGLANLFGPTSNGSRALVSTSPNLYNASFWAADDKRKTLLQIRGTNGIYYNFKYRLPSTSSDWAPIVRYAEVLLNVSEAAQRSGNATLALSTLNAVRNRSVSEANKYTSAPADLLLAILNERRVEFAGEGRRWGDLHRLALDAKYGKGGVPGKIEVAQTQLPTSFDGKTQFTPVILAIGYADFRFLWPIPLSETNSNPTLRGEQNPGY